MEKFSVDFEIGKSGEFEPESSFTRDYQGKEEISKLLKEFPPSGGNKKIRRSSMDWTCRPDENTWIDIYVYHPEE